MAHPGRATLASYFPTKQRQKNIDAQPEKTNRNNADDSIVSTDVEKSEFRFAFRLEAPGDGAAAATADEHKSKKKKKKNKNKKKAKQQQQQQTDTAGNAADAGATSQPVEVKAAPVPALAPVAAASRQPPSNNSKATKGKHVGGERPAPASKAAPSSSFVKLRKPSTTDSEVMKMQLKYGQGRRNLAAIAQRAKRKQQQQQTAPTDGARDAAAPAASSFQFNFGADTST